MQRVVRRGWSVRIRYSSPRPGGPRSFVAYGRTTDAVGHPWFETRRAARVYAARLKAHGLSAYAVRATLSIAVYG